MNKMACADMNYGMCMRIMPYIWDNV